MTDGGDSRPTAHFPGLLVEKDVPIAVRDGTELAADVFRPDDGAPVPVIMTLGPYPKDIHFKDWVARSQGASVYDELPERGPYIHWETVPRSRVARFQAALADTVVLPVGYRSKY